MGSPPFSRGLNPCLPALGGGLFYQEERSSSEHNKVPRVRFSRFWMSRLLGPRVRGVPSPLRPLSAGRRWSAALPVAPCDGPRCHAAHRDQIHGVSACPWSSGNRIDQPDPVKRIRHLRKTPATPATGRERDSTPRPA